MIIRKLKVVNVRGLKDATFVPPEEAALVIVAGNNGAGKSSALDSIAYALGGTTLVCEEPIRHGETKASVEIDLGGMTVKRVWTPSGSRLEVIDTTAGKDPIPSPQTFLDRIVGGIAFDPLAFLRHSAKEQAAMLAELLSIDFTQADKARAAAVEARTDARKKRTEYTPKIEAFKAAGVPEEAMEEVSLAAILIEVQAGTETNAAADATVEEARRMATRLAQAENDVEIAERALAQQRIVRADLLAQKVAADNAAADAPRIDLAELTARMESSEEFNRLARQSKEFEALRSDAAAADEKVEKENAMVLKIDAWKKKTLAAAVFPVPGLSFDDDGTGLSFNGIPLSQASASEQLKVGVGMGLAMTKDVKILLLRDGSLLDDGSLEDIEAMAAEAGVQLWVERVGQDGPATWIIEDGRILTQGETP